MQGLSPLVVHGEELSLRAAFSREEQSDVAGSNLTARAAGSASPLCLHNVGYGRPATRACLMV